LARFANGKWEDVGHEWGCPGTESRGVWFARDDALRAVTEDRVVYLPWGAQRFMDPGMPLKGQPFRPDFAQAEDGMVWMAELARSAHTLPQVGDQNPITEVRVGAAAVLIDRKGSGLRRSPLASI
jgi:hypothetical protein